MTSPPVLPRGGDAGRPRVLRGTCDSADRAHAEGRPREVEVDPNGRGLTYCAAESHYDMTLKLLALTEDADGLPRAVGEVEVEALAAGEGLWHVDNGGWTPDGRSVVYTRDTDTGDVFVMEGAF